MNFKTTLTTRFPALASSDYILFLIGQFLSVIGTWMQNTAQPYLAYRISGRPLDLGLIGFAATLPTLLLALPAGVFVEHWDKRKTVIILQSIMAVQAFGLAALTFSGHIQIWHITVLAFLFGTASAVEITARQAMLIELAGREALPSAIALQTTAFNTGRILGPLAAAWVMTFTNGAALVFLINGISFLFVIAGLIIARTPYAIPPRKMQFKNLLSNLVSEFSEGVAYIRSNTVVLTVILMATLLGSFGMPLLQQLPAFARDVLRTMADTEAMVATRTSQIYAVQGIGALVAAFLAAYYSVNSRKGLMLILGQAVFIVSLVAMSFTTALPLALVLMVLVGYGSVTQLVIMNTLIQVQVPNDLRGRVFAVYLWALQGVAPFGSLLIGASAQNWGVSFSMLLGALVMFITVSGLHLVNPGVRQTTA